MNQFYISTLAIAISLTFSAGAMAQSMSKDAYQAGKDDISAAYKSAKANCDSFAGNVKDRCRAEARGNEKIAMADLAFNYKPTNKTRYEAHVARAEADYAVAKELCDDKAGNVKDVCRKAAKATEVAAKADAKAQMKIAAANQTANEKSGAAHMKADAKAADANQIANQKSNAAHMKADEKAVDARKDAAEDKRDADFAVAREKCDVYAGDAKNLCVNEAKTRFGKS